MNRRVTIQRHYPYAPILRPLPPSILKGHTEATRRKLSPSPSRTKESRKRERDDHRDESKIIFFIITIGGAVLFPFYGPSTS